MEIDARITKAKQKRGMLRTLMKLSFISRNTQEREHKTVIRAPIIGFCENFRRGDMDEENALRDI